MKRLSLLVVFCLIALPAGAAPQRVVSINLCSDILAALLAEPGTLKSVYRIGKLEADSPVTDLLSDIPANQAQAEEVIALRPDLVLAHRFTSPFTLAILKELGIPVVQVREVNSFDDIRANIRLVADALDKPEDGEALVAGLDAALQIAERPVGADAPRAILYQNLGTAATKDTLLGQLLAWTGFDNLASDIPSNAFGNLSLEGLIEAQPDVLITTEYRGGEDSQATAILSHPALVAFIGDERRTEHFSLPYQEITCGSPFIAGAALRLAEARDRYDRRAANRARLAPSEAP